MTDRWNDRFSYLDAGDIDDDRIEFDGLDVLDPAGQKLGEVDGFIVERQVGRPRYVVVNSGGWFTSRDFLVPIGHTRLDRANEVLQADVDKSAIQRFPEYDADRFPEMSEDEARSFNERTLEACCATELGGRTGTDRLDYDRWSHYAQPDWWRSGWYTSPPVDRTVIGARPVPGTASYDVPTPSSETRARERVIARDRADIDVDRTRRDRLDEGTVEERAQPGDVLGIEHAGETTSLGETAHDERERLRDEEEAAAKLRREEIERRKDRR